MERGTTLSSSRHHYVLPLSSSRAAAIRRLLPPPSCLTPKVEERLVAIDKLLNADEVFCTGTAVVVSPVGSISYLRTRVAYGNGGVGAVSQRLYSALTSLQMGITKDKMDC